MAELRAFVPGYDYDVFISYAYSDDVTTGDEHGWVKQFHQHLAVHLARRLGRADCVRIWRDEKPTGKDVFDGDVKNRITASAVFLSLTSQAHLASAECRQEVRWFYEQARQETRRRRFFNVLLQDVSCEQWPADLAGITGHPFHDPAGEGEVARPLTPTDREFHDRLRTLADGIYQTLHALATARGRGDLAAGPGPVGEACDVYLAPVPATLTKTRSRLVQELVRRGITVRDQMTRTEWEATGAVAQAALSVHLLDAEPGTAIDGEEAETCHREQLRLGREFARSQMIWVPRSLDPAPIEEDSQRGFLAALENGERGDGGYDFVRSAASELADEIADRLSRLPRTEPDRPAPAAALVDVQLRDQLAVVDLGRALLERNVIPYVNPQDPDPRRNQEVLRSRLGQVGALIIVHGQADANWVKGRLVQAVNLATAEGYALRSFCIYLAPPADEKPDLRRHFPFLNLHVLDNRKGFDPETLAPLFADLGAGGA